LSSTFQKVFSFSELKSKQRSCHSSRTEQTEDRISELEDEMATKGKTEELLVNNTRPAKRKCKN
jgi:guanylate kinase